MTDIKGIINMFDKMPTKETLLNALAHIGKTAKFIQTEMDSVFAIKEGNLIFVSNLVRVGANVIIEKTHIKDN